MGSPLVLASASPRRLDLLKSLGIQDIHVMPSCLDETPRKGELPSNYVLRVATEKGQDVFQRMDSKEFVIAADTIPALGRRIFQKANTPDEAHHQITHFSGRRHRVYTGLCLITPEGKVRQRVVCTRVCFKRLSSLEINTFVESKTWEGVSGYRLQGIAAAFITWIQGTPSNVMGLPLPETVMMLQGNGYSLWT